jgi:flagellin-specific chaperone FliS
MDKNFINIANHYLSENTDLTEAQLRSEIMDRINEIIHEELKKILGTEESAKLAADLSDKVYKKIVGNIIQNFRKPEPITV